ncbi:MAG TPA: glycosyltransferase family 4 protein [Nitrospira sp.]|nr:glycosyltransferase family 4 protein [Nitrospira sp.]
MTRRVLYIHGIGQIGGAERDLQTMLQELDRSAWEPVVACPADGAFQGTLRQAGLTVVPLDLPPWRKWLSFFARRAAVERLRGLIERLQPSVVHVNDIWWVPHTLSAVRSSKSSRRPVVAHVRQEIETDKVGRYHLDRADFVIAISRHIEGALARGGVKPDKVRTIYSGLRFNTLSHDDAGRTGLCRALGLSDTVLLLGTVANLFPRKGYHVMLQALPAIMEAVPAVHYVLIGTGDDRYAESLKQLARDLGIADRVHFAGFRNPVEPVLAALDLYVHPALMEGFGIAVVEAMAQGKAVVATTTGGLPEVVDHEQTGLLVDPGSPSQLSKAVVDLLSDGSRRERMGKLAAVQARERFDVDKTVRAMESLYRTLLDR